MIKSFQTLANVTMLGILLAGCSNTLNSRKREDISAQPPRFEAPYDQVPEPVPERYSLNYETVTLSRSDGQLPEPINLYDSFESNKTPEIYNVGSNGDTNPLNAIPAPNKPGFVISPYAPSAGLVDVRGFSAGTEVRDPYSGRTMMIPITEVSDQKTEIDKKQNIQETGSPLLRKSEEAGPRGLGMPSVPNTLQPSNEVIPPTLQMGPPMVPTN